MKRLVISSVGTSLLTNATSDEIRKNLIQYANATNYQNGLSESLIQECEKRAIEKLHQGAEQARKASAELNGIYGIYGGKLPDKCQDMHFLITTDTIQGKTTANIVKDFLNQNAISAEVISLKNFSTASKTHFSEGIQYLLKWCDDTINEYREKKYDVIFNLTGGFKSQQGFMNTIGMFYADKIVYIFESSSELIEIPRLPIQIDKRIFEEKASLFLRHYAGEPFSIQDFKGIPETLFDRVDDEVHPSIWGELSWNKIKYEILSKRLVELPNLIYEPSFVEDFKNTSRDGDKTKLQEVLAKVSRLLNTSNGDVGALKRDTGLLYEEFQNKRIDGEPIAHFRVSQSLRISCIKEKNTLKLRHYGEHDYVNDNP